MRLFCYGDSNTYGFDSRPPLGGRYPASIRWTNLVSEHTGFTLINRGQNGRELPKRESKLLALEDAICKSQSDGMIIMLGGNDILQGQNAAQVTECMKRLLMRPLFQTIPVLLIASPPLKPGSWVSRMEQIEQSVLLAENYRALAEELQISFADAGQWEIQRLSDGVHFSPDGHRAFAAGLESVLDDFIKKCEEAKKSRNLNKE